MTEEEYEPHLPPIGLDEPVFGVWQPIETLPKSECIEVLAYRPKAHETDDPAIALVETTTIPRTSPQGVKHYTDRWCHPSHWMPLHPPPQPSDNSK